MKKILFVLILIFSFQSCIKEFGNKSFSKNSWILRKLNGYNLPSDINPYLNFDGHKIWGNFACNTYEGNATITSNVVKFENISSTKKDCIGINDEQNLYLKLLNNINGAEIVGSRLFFYIDGKRVMVFYKSALQMK